MYNSFWFKNFEIPGLFIYIYIYYSPELVSSVYFGLTPRVSRGSLSWRSVGGASPARWHLGWGVDRLDSPRPNMILEPLNPPPHIPVHFWKYVKHNENLPPQTKDDSTL